MDTTAEKLVNFLNCMPVSKWGIGDISGLHPLTREYPRAISLLLAYSTLFDGYKESSFHNLLEKKRLEFDHIIDSLRNFLEEQNIKHIFVPHGGQVSETLIGMFPHKLAATRAGLGWIGKNSLLITEEYGPRIRLMTVLIDLDLLCSEPVNVSQCNDCRICVDACPYGCITGMEWYPGIDRDLLFDPFSCSSKRAEFMKSIGRKHSCGLCLLSCKKGM